MRNPILLVAALAFAAPLAGCTVYTRAAVVEEPAYEPVYYGPHVVYYDDAGAPYYYQGATIVYVPRTYARYDVLVGHYHGRSASYRTWRRSNPPPTVHRHGPPRVRHRH